MPSHGLFHRNTLLLLVPVMTSLHLLPRLLPPPGEPSNQGCSCPDAILHMCYAFRSDYSILHFSFSFSKGKQLQFTEQLHIGYFVHYGSRILGK